MGLPKRPQISTGLEGTTSNNTTLFISLFPCTRVLECRSSDFPCWEQRRHKNISVCSLFLYKSWASCNPSLGTQSIYDYSLSLYVVLFLHCKCTVCFKRLLVRKHCSLLRDLSLCFPPPTSPSTQLSQHFSSLRTKWGCPYYIIV